VTCGLGLWTPVVSSVVPNSWVLRSAVVDLILWRQKLCFVGCVLAVGGFCCGITGAVFEQMVSTGDGLAAWPLALVPVFSDLLLRVFQLCWCWGFCFAYLPLQYVATPFFLGRCSAVSFGG
ncbi:hypothetical protein Ancab_006387, partial [Ancistrocladus abbreviatus]